MRNRNRTRTKEKEKKGTPKGKFQNLPLTDSSTSNPLKKLTQKEQKILREKLSKDLTEITFLTGTGEPSQSIDDIRVALKLGADVNATNVVGDTLLIKAACAGEIEICKLLIKYGANINSIDTGGMATALMEAAERGHTEICRLLVKHGADIDMGNDDCWTALTWAAVRGHTQTVKYLLSAGANPLIKKKTSSLVGIRNPEDWRSPTPTYEGAARICKEEGAYELARDPEIKQIIKFYDGLWKRLGKGDVLKTLSQIRRCHPETVEETYMNL